LPLFSLKTAKIGVLLSKRKAKITIRWGKITFRLGAIIFPFYLLYIGLLCHNFIKGAKHKSNALILSKTGEKL
jgi:hypothetical protein